MTGWFGAVRTFDAGGPAAHSDAVLLSLVDGVDADFVCTHVDRGGVVARAAMTVRLRHAGDAAALGGRLGAPVTPLAGPPDGSRCMRFPGQDTLTGVLPAIELVAHSAIDEVTGVGATVTPDAPVDTQGFLRPTFSSGRLVLLVEKAAGGVLRPVEIEQPHQCCGGH